jgi:transcription factor Dp-1
MKVCQKVESKKATNYNEVGILQPNTNINPGCRRVGKGISIRIWHRRLGNFFYQCIIIYLFQKNIRRRVYDALNVLMAMNIIAKDKKDIRWLGLPTNAKQELDVMEVIILHSISLKVFRQIKTRG